VDHHVGWCSGTDFTLRGGGWEIFTCGTAQRFNVENQAGGASPCANFGVDLKRALAVDVVITGLGRRDSKERRIEYGERA